MEGFKYPDDWRYEIAESNSNLTVVRANLASENDAIAWVRNFGILNQAKWITKGAYAKNKTSVRYISHKRWVCQHANINKCSTSNKATGCSMGVDIKIKLITTQTKKKDSYLKLQPALQAVIKIEGTHNHPTDSAKMLGYLRISDATKAQYEEYFKSGLGISAAIKCHEEKLHLSGANESDLADSSKNPTYRMVQYVYEKFMNKKHKHSDHIKKLNKAQTHAESDISNSSDSSLHGMDSILPDAVPHEVTVSSQTSNKKQQDKWLESGLPAVCRDCYVTLEKSNPETLNTKVVKAIQESVNKSSNMNSLTEAKLELVRLQTEIAREEQELMQEKQKFAQEEYKYAREKRKELEYVRECQELCRLRLESLKEKRKFARKKHENKIAQYKLAKNELKNAKENQEVLNIEFVSVKTESTT